MRKISKEGLALIKQLEGLRLGAYEDSGGVWTIGYGHTSAAGAPSVHKDMQITEKEAEKILCQDLKECESVAEKAVTVPLNDE